ncbi:threonine synthase [Buchnera aphidicola]|uniref:Threonine synthase n=1 Tax=Buchnera aphidicola (Cinara cf. splendens/pseudotsugae 3390) TaxID=2518980 RepID=A0A451CXL3_9GAMM|nr:threonine synthase [Buchnera aphidicola]VFP77703.1 Threonine synthase [Buchnera aphidicola (Cinara cf. splendens/pseudotsugae 3390)]
MKLYNLKDHTEEVNFLNAIQSGLGKKQGLFFPKYLPKFNSQDLKKLIKMDFITRSTHILSHFISDEISLPDLKKQIKSAFSFTPPIIVPVTKNISCLELFHGPTLAFKDFGARFMANMLSYWKNKNSSMTILTATSGDTGAAVAHAFYCMNNIRVVILYPKGRISVLQEKLFCTLGKNIHTIAIDGSFDDCQYLVKQSFNDKKLKEKIGLNSANSINISRLLAQICYYFEAFALIPSKHHNDVVISVPCGNFGNLTAGLIAKSLGLPIKSFIAATNANDTVPRFLNNGVWKPNNTISTISNAMDISEPNNWPRVEELFRRKNWNLHTLKSESISDKKNIKTLQELYKIGYISEPHAAIAYKVLVKNMKKTDFGLFLGTAHPSKFQDTVESILNIKLKLPYSLKSRVNLKNFSHHMKPDFLKLKNFLLTKI